MTEDDSLRTREVKALEQAVALFARQVDAQTAPRGFVDRWGVLIGAAGVIVTLVVSLVQVRTAQGQFERTLRENQYSDIVNGLASSSVGVQVNSIRRVTQYVRDPDNFEDEEARRDAAVNVVQTLMAFIQDESLVPGREGLSDFRDPQPVVVARATTHLKVLLGVEEFSGIDIDLSRGNFHGIDLVDLETRGKFLAVGADFRRARVTGWKLAEAASVDLTAAFFTCADLRNADLGQADVASADFTGTDLRGADLSGVSNLGEDQLSGARVGPVTRLPEDVDPPRRSWGVEDDEDGGATVACRDLVDGMTDLVAGAGYSSRFPCPGTGPDAARARLSQPEFAALRRVCQARAGPPSGARPAERGR